MEWTREKLFNAVLTVLKETGQGVPKMVIDSITNGEDLLNDLIKDNLLVIRNEKDVCINGVYNIEEDFRVDHLLYLRKYLGLDEDLDSADISFIENYAELYDEWVKLNFESVEKFRKMSFL